MDAGRLNGTPLASPSPLGERGPDLGPQCAPAPAGAREAQPTRKWGRGRRARRKDAEAATARASTSPQVRSRGAIAAVPVILVNAVAFCGQLAFLHDHLPWPLAGQVMMAVALESIAVYLAFHAHQAQLADDSALRLRLASYGFAAVIGAMNYSHYAAPHGRPTFPAVAVGLMSASSPWLWAIHSRRVSRDTLLASGLIEPHALRLGPTRWAWHPLRSFRVMFLATWEGITEPRLAVTRWENAATDAATERDRIAAEEENRHRDTEAAADAAQKAAITATVKRPAVRQPKRHGGAADWRPKAARIVAAESGIRAADLAARCRIHKRTAERFLAEPEQMKARHLAAVPEEETG